ncbi:hypothetical protein EFE22_09480 [Lactobacillus delbrueckii subsp. lactis]|nr:hypothetical protein [Lactobacillus delbrueckii subsp. lactis]
MTTWSKIDHPALYAVVANLDHDHWYVVHNANGKAKIYIDLASALTQLERTREKYACPVKLIAYKLDAEVITE